jgi:lysozyme
MINKAIAKKLSAMGLSAALVLAGAGTVSHFEGKENKAYLDPVNIMTICYGQTSGVKKGDYKTNDECLESLAEELVIHDKGMMKAISVPLTGYQHAAFLSFCYNVGVGKCTGSTAFKMLNRGEYERACRELKRWNKAKGKVLKGLTLRREAEYKMCMGEANETSKE